jgi:hypothetical protein
MAEKSKSPGLSETEIASLRSAILRRPGPIFDPVDMEHILQVDRALGRQLLAQRLETQAEISRAVADGAAKVAKLMR